MEQVLREFDSSGHRRIALALQVTAGSEVKHDENATGESDSLD